MATSEAVVRREADKIGTVTQYLSEVTGQPVAYYHLVRKLLPVNLQDKPEAVILYAMRCNQLGIDPFGGGLYAADFGDGGQISFVASYGAMLGIVQNTGKLAEHWGDVVYPGEEFQIDTRAGTVTHKMDPAKRHGLPLGAYYFVKRADRDAGRLCYASFEQRARKSDKGLFKNWRNGPERMILKCALRDALSLEFPAEMNGVHEESFGDDPASDEPKKIQIQDMTPADPSEINRLKAEALKTGRSWNAFCADAGISNRPTAEEVKRGFDFLKPEPDAQPALI